MKLLQLCSYTKLYDDMIKEALNKMIKYAFYYRFTKEPIVVMKRYINQFDVSKVAFCNFRGHSSQRAFSLRLQIMA